MMTDGVGRRSATLGFKFRSLNLTPKATATLPRLGFEGSNPSVSAESHWNLLRLLSYY